VEGGDYRINRSVKDWGLPPYVTGFPPPAPFLHKGRLREGRLPPVGGQVAGMIRRTADFIRLGGFSKGTGAETRPPKTGFPPPTFARAGFTGMMRVVMMMMMVMLMLRAEGCRPRNVVVVQL